MKDGNERPEKQQRASEGQDGVDDGDARDALDGAHPGAGVQVVVVQGGQEVREEGEHDDGAAELDAAEEELRPPQGDAVAAPMVLSADGRFRGFEDSRLEGCEGWRARDVV